jgi:anti-sigma factor RsiW
MFVKPLDGWTQTCPSATTRIAVANLPIDAEEMAAFLDGRLVGEPRARMAARLAADPEWADFLVDVAAVAAAESEAVRSSNAVAPAAVVVTTRSLHRATPHGARPWLRAAAIVGLGLAAALTIVLLRRSPVPDEITAVTPSVDPSTVLALGNEITVSDAMREGRWTVTRSGSIVLSSNARAVRLGVLAVDATLALRGGGGDALAAERNTIVELLSSAGGSSVATALLRTAADSVSLRIALDAVRGVVDTTLFDVGAWTELQLLALQRKTNAPGALTQPIPPALGTIAARDPMVKSVLEQLLLPTRSNAERTAQLRAVLQRLAE